MPFSVQVDQTRDLILISLWGSVGDSDLVNLSQAVRAEPALRLGASVLYDCRGVTDVGISGSLISKLGVAARKDPNRIAFLANSPVAIGLARMYQIVSEGQDRMQIFADEKSARQWLLGG